MEKSIKSQYVKKNERNASFVIENTRPRHLAHEGVLVSWPGPLASMGTW